MKVGAVAAVVRRKSRPDSQREQNNAVVAAYGRVLRQHIEEIEHSPSPAAVVPSAVQQMQDVARATFTPAFLDGKRQVIGAAAYIGPHDRIWIDRKLYTNHHYLAMSLAPDILEKIHRLKLHVPGRRTSSLGRSFGFRVADLYGGQLWTVHEAGYRSGVDEVRHMLRGLGMPPLPREEDRNHDWLALAFLLRVSLAELEEHHQTIAVGAQYNAVLDAQTCSSCAEVVGDYFPASLCPLPGEVCEGFGNCRCFLSVVTRTVTDDDEHD